MLVVQATPTQRRQGQNILEGEGHTGLVAIHHIQFIKSSGKDAENESQPNFFDIKSARFQVPKSGTSSAPIQERTPKTSRNTPHNGWVDIWVMRFHFRASTKTILKNPIFSIILEPFHPLNEAKILGSFPPIKNWP